MTTELTIQQVTRIATTPSILDGKSSESLRHGVALLRRWALLERRYETPLYRAALANLSVAERNRREAESMDTPQEAAYRALVVNHDVSYSYSDDHRVYCRGVATYKDLTEYAAQHLTPTVAARIWNEVVEP